MNKFRLSFLLTAVCSILFMSAASVNSLPPERGNENTPLAVFSDMRDALETKAAETTLTKKEAKMLKRLDRKVTKWENRNEKRIEKGKKPNSGKSWIAALLLCWLVGIIGIHRFYLGYTWQGVVQILTLGGLGIWTLIDLIRIIIRDLQPKDGTYDD